MDSPQEVFCNFSAEMVNRLEILLNSPSTPSKALFSVIFNFTSGVKVLLSAFNAMPERV